MLLFILCFDRQRRYLASKSSHVPEPKAAIQDALKLRVIYLASNGGKARMPSRFEGPPKSNSTVVIKRGSCMKVQYIAISQLANYSLGDPTDETSFKRGMLANCSK